MIKSCVMLQVYNTKGEEIPPFHMFCDIRQMSGFFFCFFF